MDSLEQVFAEIKKQTGYTFVYTDALLQKAKLVSINAKDAALEKVLEDCFRDQPLTYSILNKIIIIREKEIAPEPEKLYTPPPPVTITGKITNENNEALAGATIIEEGTQNSTVSKEDGTFSITVAGPSSKLKITFVGFEAKEIVVGSQSEINVKLSLAIPSLTDMVVVGYGTQKKNNLTGSTANVSASAYKDQPVVNVSSALQGRASGVSVSSASGAPGGATKDQDQWRQFH